MGKGSEGRVKVKRKGTHEVYGLDEVDLARRGPHLSWLEDAVEPYTRPHGAPVRHVQSVDDEERANIEFIF